MQLRDGFRDALVGRRVVGERSFAQRRWRLGIEWTVSIELCLAGLDQAHRVSDLQLAERMRMGAR